MSEEFTCDCGHKWLKGQSGRHSCSPYYQKKIKQLTQKNKALSETLTSWKRTILSGIIYESNGEYFTGPLSDSNVTNEIRTLIITEKVAMEQAT